ncbi:glycosyltransferase family 2 protein, partial [Candidatus Bathyarchaeota archaeon]
VEDGSKDRTLEICNNFSQQYPWIKVFHRDASIGKGDALNFGFNKSTGEVIATFDADDIPEPLAITKALRYFNDPEVGAVHGYHRTLNLQESIGARGQVRPSGHSDKAGSGRELARDAGEGQEPVEAADTVEWREHSDGFEALGRVEVNVPREGVRYGSVNDESHNGDSSFRRLGASSAGRGPYRDTSR